MRPHRTILPALICSAAPARAQGLATGTGLDVSWLRVVLALLFCLFLAAAAVIVLQRQKAGSWSDLLGKFRRPLPADGNQGIRILETRRASQHADLCSLEFGGRLFLVALTPGGATVLDRYDPDGDPDCDRDGALGAGDQR